MKEIKFRMWLGGRFHYWGFIKSRFGDDYEFHAIADTNVEPLTMTEKMERSQQYTGLKDKNGTEIYEGDIVIAGYHWTKPHAIELPSDYYDFSEYSLNGEDLEVIGNICENPELIDAHH